MTSAAPRAASATASSPSPASPVTHMSGCASSIIRNPARTSSWSSTSATLIGAGACRSRRPRLGARGGRRAAPALTPPAAPLPGASGSVAVTCQPPPGRGPAVIVPPCTSARSPHADEPVPKAVAARAGADLASAPSSRALPSSVTLITSCSSQNRSVTPAVTVGPPCLRALVSDSCTIRYAASAAARRQRPRHALHGERDGQSGRAGLLEQPGELFHARLRRQVHRRCRTAERSTPSRLRISASACRPVREIAVSACVPSPATRRARTRPRRPAPP